MTPLEAEHMALELMNKHGLTDWHFCWDRAKQRAGCCKHLRKMITLSVHYVNLNENRPYDILDTILHEIAHALAGYGAGHGPKWQAVCRRIGARPVRCYDSSIAMPDGRYVATCGSCGKTYYRHRRPRAGWRYWCRTCGRDDGALEYSVHPLEKVEKIFSVGVDTRGSVV